MVVGRVGRFEMAVGMVGKVRDGSWYGREGKLKWLTDTQFK